MISKREEINEVSHMIAAAYCLVSVHTAAQGKGIQIKATSLVELKRWESKVARVHKAEYLRGKNEREKERERSRDLQKVLLQPSIEY